jgi:predicted enzyme related to lactoylglutathione lyase
MFADSQAFSSFAVKDLEEARGFYEGKLGLSWSEAEMGVAQLGVGGGRTILVYPKDDHEPAGYTILNFPVDDVEAAVGALAEQGIEPERYEGFGQDERGILRDPSGPAIAWFT